MIRLKLAVSGVKPVQYKIALIVIFAICVTVLGLPLACLAQAGGGGFGGNGRTPGGRNPGGRTPAGRTPPGPAADAEPPEPAEPEEGPPEKTYDSLPVDTALRKLDSKIRATLHAGNYENPQAKADFEPFYTGYFFPRWSVQQDIRNLPHYRQDLMSHLRTAIPGQPRNDLISLALAFLKRLVVGDFHPAVKINAMLAIGELNRVESSAGVKAVPLPEALDVLLTAAGSNKFSEGLRVAAMVGILRHAAAGIPGSDAQKKVNDLMLRLVAADMPAGSVLSSRTWLVAQAAEALGDLGAVGENNEAFAALLKLVANDKLPFAVRYAAVDALGHLDYSSANGINPLDTATVVARLAIDGCKDGLATAKDTTRLPFRRRVLCRLTAVQSALGGDEEKNHKGILSLAKEQPQQEFIAGLQKSLKEAIDEIDHKEDPRLDITKEPDVKLKDMKDTVTKLQASLERLLQKKP
jgi:hypothetical protein